MNTKIKKFLFTLLEGKAEEEDNHKNINAIFIVLEFKKNSDFRNGLLC